MKAVVAILVDVCVAAQTVINVYTDFNCSPPSFYGFTVPFSANTSSPSNCEGINAYSVSIEKLLGGVSAGGWYYAFNDLAGSQKYGVLIYKYDDYNSFGSCFGKPVLNLSTLGTTSVPTTCTYGFNACIAAGGTGASCDGSFYCESGCTRPSPSRTPTPTVTAQVTSSPAPVPPALPDALKQTTVRMQLCDNPQYTYNYCASTASCTTWTALLGQCVTTVGTGGSSSFARNGGSAIITATNLYWYSDARCTTFSFYFPISLATNPTASCSLSGTVSGMYFNAFAYKALATVQAVTSGGSTTSSLGSNTLAVALFDSTCTSPLTTLQYSSSTPGCVATTTYSSTSSFSWGCDGSGNTLINVHLFSASCSTIQPDLTTGFIPAGSDKCYMLNGYFFGFAGMKLLSSPCSSLPATPGLSTSSGSTASAIGVSGATVAVSVFVCLAIVGGAAAFFMLGGAALVASTFKRRPTVLSSKASFGANVATGAVVSAPNPLSTSFPQPVTAAQPLPAAAVDVPLLPPGWSEAWSRTKNAVYWRHTSGTTSWTRPVVDSDLGA